MRMGFIVVENGKIFVIPPKGNEQIFSSWANSFAKNLKFNGNRKCWSGPDDMKALVDAKFIKEGWIVSREKRSFDKACDDFSERREFSYVSPEKKLEDAYGVLFLKASAPKEVVSAAFKALSKMLHPDLHPDKEDDYKAVSEAKFHIFKEKGW